VNKEKFKNYVFNNELLTYESHIHGFSDKVFAEYDKKSEEKNLRSKIENLMNAKVVNHTENKAAFHPQYRKKDNKFGGRDELSPSSLSRLNSKLMAKDIREANVIVLAIGGSYEGPKLLLESINQHDFNCVDSKVNYLFITGSDPNEFVSKTQSLNPKDTIFIVASKSFKTDETIESLKLALEWSIDATYFIAITSNINEPLRYGIGVKNKGDIIDFDNEVGGRYSIWSPIGQFISDFNEFNEFLDGGSKADEDLLKPLPNDYLDFIKYLAFSDIWQNNSQGKNIRAVLSYIWNMRSFPDYIQQLEMESLGKQANPTSGFRTTGQIIFGGYGPTAQHSYFQLLHQGTQEICADIIASKENLKSLSYAQAITQSKLLSTGAKDLKEEEKINGNIPVNLFLLKKADPFSIGYLLASWEHRVFITSVMLGINPFDQFGVSAGKIYTKKHLDENGG
tara:strand:- start:556 stop:1911 length:1356 start_codon:yes stop_codon:yes gene_type:complete